MNIRNIVAVIFIAIGIAALVYGGFIHSSDVRKTNMGVPQLSFYEEEPANIPVWTGVAFILAGSVVFLVRRKT